ncbi:MAG: Maf family protein, partial [Anaerolineae bacterium]|nr:Maf family protein [Anaerolineae bacterium]
VASATVDETPRNGEVPAMLAVRLARAKGQALSRNLVADLSRGNQAACWILSADTVVEYRDHALGKPQDADEARAMLRQLRAGPHRVHSAVTLRDLQGDCELTRRATTDVQMRAYSDREIDAYIATGDPFDKAGAYAVQHPDFRPVLHMDRCYANVVGLPLCAVATLLRACGAELTLDMPALCRRHFGYSCPGPDEGVCL